MITDIIENIKDKHNKPILEMTDKIEKYEEEITALKNELSSDSVIIAENEGKLKQWKSDYLALQKILCFRYFSFKISNFRIEKSNCRFNKTK